MEGLVRRREDWPLRLNAALESARARAFAWGEHDCCMFAAGVVRELTGEDFAAPFRGAYAERDGAGLILAEQGGVEAITTAALGAPLDNPRFAQRGDVVLIETEEGMALGICDGVNAWLPGVRGLVHRPMPHWRAAWRV